jgi:hypothetical protein
MPKLYKTYKKKRGNFRKSIKRKQRGGNKEFIFDAAKIHPASLLLDKKFIIKKSSIDGSKTHYKP